MRSRSSISCILHFRLLRSSRIRFHSKDKTELQVSNSLGIFPLVAYFLRYSLIVDFSVLCKHNLFLHELLLSKNCITWLPDNNELFGIFLSLQSNIEILDEKYKYRSWVFLWLLSSECSFDLALANFVSNSCPWTVCLRVGCNWLRRDKQALSLYFPSFETNIQSGLRSTLCRVSRCLCILIQDCGHLFLPSL